MSRKVLCTLLYVCTLTISLYGQQDHYVFDDELYEYYDKALDLNESNNYLDAYRQIVLAEKSITATLAECDIRASALGDNEFRYPYWAVKKSKAEIAYMLGIYTDMELISEELRQSLDSKKWAIGLPEISSIIDCLEADVAKIDGSRYFLTEKYDSAETALNTALLKGNFNGNENFVVKVYGDMAQLHYKQGRYNKTLADIDSILANPLYRGVKRQSISDLFILEVNSWKAICLARLGKFSEALEEIESVLNAHARTTNKRLYAETLRKKAKILMLEYDSTDEYNPSAKTCYQQYLSISKNFIDNQFIDMSESEREQYWMTEQPFVTDCFRMEGKAPELLYDVALYSKAMLLQMGRDFKEGMTKAEKRKSLSSIRVTWKQVRDCLPTSGCAVEFVTYEKKGENHIGALVIDKKSVCPTFIGIGKVSAISDYQLTENLKVRNVFADTQNKENINKLYNDTTLRTLIWNTEMVKAIGDCKDIYFSPDGIFHQLGIEYLTPKAIEGKKFFRLTTTRLLTQKKQMVHTDKMLLCGGVEYGFSTKDTIKGNDELAYSLLASLNLRIAPLPNSSVEADSIKAIRKHHTEDMALCADSVTEEALNRLLGKYHIVHISTHGLFAEVAKIGTEIRPSSTDQQLSKSCLFLSGSGKNLSSRDFDASTHDGILSARELAKKDLSSVGLAVLSACMSGVGYITPDGVYGLQRGLKTAGVKTIISTLWSVDDEASCLFMIHLYRNLEAGKGLHEAFRMAREALKKDEDEKKEGIKTLTSANSSFMQRRRTPFTPNFNNPYFYNAFILIDGIE